jgi:uncharacterized membrane protein
MIHQTRYPEIDILRTLAIIMMMIYHLLFDLATFYEYNITVTTGGWRMFARVTATLFLLLVGVSASLATPSWKKSIRRFLKIGAAAMLVTAATYVTDPQTYVRFGILHLIATSALVLPLFDRWKKANVALGIAIVLIGTLVNGTIVDTSLLIPAGFLPLNFQSVDWFPLLPWFGVIVIGHGLGHVLYALDRSIRPTPILNILGWPGRHALGIYLIHQPILLGILYLILGSWS